MATIIMNKMNGRIKKLFWAKVNKTGSCWLWMACTLRGYGQYSFGGKNYRSHRLSWEEVNGPIQKGLQIDHLCRVRNCVNPKHLDVVTNKENHFRARREKCKWGHPFSTGNTYHYPIKKNGVSSRKCRTCHREQEKIRRANIREHSKGDDAAMRQEMK